MMVEVMCGILGGGSYAHHIRKWSVEERREADLVCNIYLCTLKASSQRHYFTVGSVVHSC